MAAERALLDGLLSSFDFELAEHLHMTVEQLRRTMPNSEYVQWAAFFNVRRAQKEVE